jgi:hypothetical protein
LGSASFLKVREEHTGDGDKRTDTNYTPITFSYTSGGRNGTSGSGQVACKDSSNYFHFLIL